MKGEESKGEQVVGPPKTMKEMMDKKKGGSEGD